jgi:hypothetical protein
MKQKIKDWRALFSTLRNSASLVSTINRGIEEEISLGRRQRRNSGAERSKHILGSPSKAELHT